MERANIPSNAPTPSKKPQRQISIEAGEPECSDEIYDDVSSEVKKILNKRLMHNKLI